MKNFGLYIHIPFCLSKCSYCSFVSSPCDDYQPYIDVLCREIELKGGKYGIESCYRGKVDTVYFGGGTPSLLSIRQLCQIFTAIKSHFELSDNVEISLEVNPASASQNKLDAFCQLGINRLSVGLQCANDRILSLLGRPHNTSAFIETVAMAHKAGISNISADIIIGLPTQKLEDVSNSLRICLEQDVKHISCYALKVERGTPLYRDRKHFAMPDDDATADMYELSLSIAEEHNMRRYEVSNFATEGFECRHNLKYWRYENYLAVGASASGFVRPARYNNINNVEKYIAALRNGHNPSRCRRTPIKEQFFEYVMLALRLDEGVDCVDFANMFGISFDELYGDKARRLSCQNLLYYDGLKCKVLKAKMSVLNEILTQLLFE